MSETSLPSIDAMPEYIPSLFDDMYSLSSFRAAAETYVLNGQPSLNVLVQSTLTSYVPVKSV